MRAIIIPPVNLSCNEKQGSTSLKHQRKREVIANNVTRKAETMQNDAVSQRSQSLRYMKREAKSHATNGKAREDVSPWSKTDKEMYKPASAAACKHMSLECRQMRGKIKRGLSQNNWQT